MKKDESNTQSEKNYFFSYNEISLEPFNIFKIPSIGFIEWFDWFFLRFFVRKFRLFFASIFFSFVILRRLKTHKKRVFLKKHIINVTVATIQSFFFLDGFNHQSFFYSLGLWINFLFAREFKNVLLLLCATM